MSDDIGIFLPGGHGDIMSAMSVLKYKDILWPGRNIQWFCSPVESECLKYAPVEIKIWEDFSQLIVSKNRDNARYTDLKNSFPSIKNLAKEYFPAPWMYLPEDNERAGKDYPNVSKAVFSVPHSWEWHPMLYFVPEEHEMVKDFCLSLPHKRTIMLETGSRSGQSAWTDAMTQNTILTCRREWGPCNFIFASLGDDSPHFHDKSYSSFFDDPGMVSCGHFTIRQAALVNNHCDLFIGISSGLSVATSCWGNKPTPKIQYTNGFTCSTVSLANGPIDLVEIHNGPNPESRYYQKLHEVLRRYA